MVLGVMVNGKDKDEVIKNLIHLLSEDTVVKDESNCMGQNHPEDRSYDFDFNWYEDNNAAIARIYDEVEARILKERDTK